MTPSKRTLVAGVLQAVVPSRFKLTLEQWPTLDDPFADSTPKVEKLKLDGTITMEERKPTQSETCSNQLQISNLTGRGRLNNNHCL